jgi:hypothetical protein
VVRSHSHSAVGAEDKQKDWDLDWERKLQVEDGHRVVVHCSAAEVHCNAAAARCSVAVAHCNVTVAEAAEDTPEALRTHVVPVAGMRPSILKHDHPFAADMNHRNVEVVRCGLMRKRSPKPRDSFQALSGDIVALLSPHLLYWKSSFLDQMPRV